MEPKEIRDTEKGSRAISTSPSVDNKTDDNTHTTETQMEAERHRVPLSPVVGHDAPGSSNAPEDTLKLGSSSSSEVFDVSDAAPVAEVSEDPKTSSAGDVTGAESSQPVYSETVKSTGQLTTADLSPQHLLNLPPAVGSPFVGNGSAVGSRKILVSAKYNQAKAAASKRHATRTSSWFCCCCCCCCQRRSKDRLCLRVSRNIFKTLLLTLLFLLYGIGGGFLFSYLESEEDTRYNNRVEKWKNDTAILLATELRQVSPYEDVWARKVYQYLDIFEKDLMQASLMGYRRRDDPEREQLWTFRSSLFYSFSLMTTTGSCHVSTRYEWGQEIIMAYTLFGVPVTLMWLATTGSSLASLWRYTFQKVCCPLCNAGYTSRVFPHHSPNYRSVSAASLQKSRASFSGSIIPMGDGLVAILFPFLLIIVSFVVGTAAISFAEEWTASDAFYFNFGMLFALGLTCRDTSEMSATNIRQSYSYMAYWLFQFCLVSMSVSLCRAFCRERALAKRRKMLISSLRDVHDISVT